MHEAFLHVAPWQIPTFTTRNEYEASMIFPRFHRFLDL